MSQTLNRKLIMLLIAFSIGLIYMLPHLVFKMSDKQDFIYYPFSFSELVYSSQVREVLSGHLTVGDPQLFEHKDTSPPIFPIMPVYLMAIISYLSGSISSGFIISDFIFPSILFLVLFTLIYKLQKDYWLAISTSLATLIAYPLTTKIPPITPYLWNEFTRRLLTVDPALQLPFYRAPDPQISFLVLSLSLWSLFSLWIRPSKKYLIITVFLAFILFNTYFYHVTFFYFVIVPLLVIAYFKEDIKRTKFLLIAFVILSFIGYLYNQVFDQPIYQTVKISAGQFHARYLDWIFTLRYAVVLLLTIYAYKKWKTPTLAFFLALGFAAILSVNFQIISGWTVQPGHWPQTTIEPLMIIIVSVVLFTFFKKTLNKKVLPVVSLLLLIYAFFYQLRFATSDNNFMGISEDASKVISWLSKNATENDVVVSSDIQLQASITAFTDANIFYPIYMYHYASDEEVWERILYTNKLFAQDLKSFDPSQSQIAIFATDQTYNVNKYKHFPLSGYSSDEQEKIGKCSPLTCTKLYLLPKSVINRTKVAYAAIDVGNSPFRLTYAILTSEDSDKNLKLLGNEVFSSGSYSIHKLR